MGEQGKAGRFLQRQTHNLGGGHRIDGVAHRLNVVVGFVGFLLEQLAVIGAVLMEGGATQHQDGVANRLDLLQAVVKGGGPIQGVKVVRYRCQGILSILLIVAKDQCDPVFIHGKGCQRLTLIVELPDDLAFGT